ncbi:MAG TPA: hypothetical protein VER55_08460, partial [Ardenticatenaceae bacterium]|nr:hypothetical protein [Ardenticatenaceae bacterium]
AGPVARRFGMGRTLVGAMLFGGAMGLLIPLARGAGLAAVALMVAAQILGDLAGTIYAINAVSLRQMVTPDRLLGRISASTQVLVGGTNTVGLLVGGVLGGLFGARVMIAAASLGILMATLWLIFSPVRKYNRRAQEMAMVEV